MWNKIQRIYIGTNLVRPPEITETYTLTPWANDTKPYKAWYKIESITIEWDFYSPSSWWTGAGWRIQKSSWNIGWYLNGWQNISNYNSSAKFESYQDSYTTLYSASNYGNQWTTTYVSITIGREKSTMRFWNNPEVTYLYSSGSKWPFINSILDDVDATILYYASSGGATLSNWVATVTYSKA